MLHLARAGPRADPQGAGDQCRSMPACRDRPPKGRGGEAGPLPTKMQASPARLARIPNEGRYPERLSWPCAWTKAKRAGAPKVAARGGFDAKSGLARSGTLVDDHVAGGGRTRALTQASYERSFASVTGVAGGGGASCAAAECIGDLEVSESRPTFGRPRAGRRSSRHHGTQVAEHFCT
jgi:hypothetical protein